MDRQSIVYNILNNLKNIAGYLIFYVIRRSIAFNVVLSGFCVPGQSESITRLDLYGERLGRFCHLEDDCLCRSQFTVEMSTAMDWGISTPKETTITFDFREPNGRFGLKVISESVSSSERCSGKYGESEGTKVFWMKEINNFETEVTSTDLLIKGFVADVKSFDHRGKEI